MSKAIVIVLMIGGLSACGERRPSPSSETEPQKTAGVNESVHETKRQPFARIENAFVSQVAGGFYTDKPKELRAQVNKFIDEAHFGDHLRDRDIAGILSPHAGYIYSGPVAGEAFAVVKGRGYRTVVILGLNHRKTSGKAAILTNPAYDTPLGSAKINQSIVRKLLDDHGGLFEDSARMFKGEHSMEVQVPFVQVALPGAKIVPIIIANHETGFIEKLGQAFFDVLGARSDVLFVISSDLSHYYPYEEAKGHDTRIIELLEQWKINEWWKIATTRAGMCGSVAMFTFAKMFEQYDASKRKVTKLAYQNSGDTAGDRSRVVGYGAIAFSLEKNMRTERDKDFGPFDVQKRRDLMNLAKEAIAAAARGEKLDPKAPSDELLKQLGAAFVTLKKNGHLRGCIGHVAARIPLYQCIVDVARSAAVHDTRFNPVRTEELSDLAVQISVLTDPKPTTPDQVVVGRDGLIVSSGRQTGLLLPQVPVEWGWNKEEYLDHTCRKAGLPIGCWRDPSVEIKSFRAIIWDEGDLDD